jgi:hypothetical protein
MLNTYATTIDMRNSHCIFSLRHAKTVPSQLHPTPTDLAGDGKNAGTEQRHLQHLRNKLLDAHLASHFCHAVGLRNTSLNHKNMKESEEFEAQHDHHDSGGL